MRIIDWCSYVCSSYLFVDTSRSLSCPSDLSRLSPCFSSLSTGRTPHDQPVACHHYRDCGGCRLRYRHLPLRADSHKTGGQPYGRSEEHTSELQSLMRISYAVFFLKKKKKTTENNNVQH